MKLYVTKHPLKRRSIVFQILELFLLPFDIVRSLHNAYNMGGHKYGWGNFSIELRRRYWAIRVHPWSIRNYILHRIGVTIMDPFGKHVKIWYSKDTGFNYKSPSNIYDSSTQYLHHFNPFVRKIVKQYIFHALEKGYSIKAY
jgi:hypothetical protein